MNGGTCTPAPAGQNPSFTCTCPSDKTGATCDGKYQLLSKYLKLLVKETRKIVICPKQQWGM